VNNDMKRLIERTKKMFPKSFINNRNELILEPKNNIYFKLEDVQSELDFKCKLIAWLSRPISKGVNKYWQRKLLKNFNAFLGTNFTNEDMRQIYGFLGNDVNRSLCVEFIESNYDLSLLKKS
jgi:hypothetical protein